MRGNMVAIVPVTKREALAFAERTQGFAVRVSRVVFTVGFADADDTLMGVVIGTLPPDIRDDGWTAMVHCFTEDERFVQSMHGAAWQAAHAMGYRRLETPTATLWVTPDHDGTRRNFVEPAPKRPRRVRWEAMMGGR